MQRTIPGHVVNALTLHCPQLDNISLTDVVPSVAHRLSAFRRLTTCSLDATCEHYISLQALNGLT